MTNMPRVLAIALSCSSLMLAQSAVAHDSGVAHDAHVGDSSGHIVTDSSGDCVRTGSWSKDQDLTDCGAPAPKAEPAPEPAAVSAPAPSPAPMPKVVTKTVSLKAGALFDVNSDALKPTGQDELNRLASQLKSMSEIQNIQITGHTDSSGAEAYNQQLSERRAMSVKNYLVDQGIPASTMSTMGMGESSPVASNASRDGRAQNRRVELTIQGAEAVTQ